MKLKDTLNLGKTDFSMRANLPTKEIDLQKEWQDANIYQQILETHKDKPGWFLHDGPPYANGNLHMGHALNQLLKDFILRSKSMLGYRTPYVPGWDTHGLPIESAMIKQDGVDRKSMSVSDFRDLCEQYALGQVDNQRASFTRLGVFGEWDNPYLTLKPEYEAQQIRVFGQMADKGYIYKGAKPVYWSPSSESSLAEAEVEYRDITSPSIYVAFKVANTQDVVAENVEFVIWTTTPWTLPANVAIAVLPEANYVQVAVDDRHFIVAEDLLETVAQTIGWERLVIEAHFKGSQFQDITVHHPFYHRESRVVTTDYVTMESGTGLVHTAPGHGEDDYIAALKYDLPIISPVDDRGHFTDEAEGLEGMFYLKGQKQVLKWLEENGALLHQSEYMHSYPHDWRTKKPVIYRATPQWFASIDKFRQELLDATDEVEWHHPSGKVRMYNMIRDRGDWVISRQRVWGVPLPIFYAEDGTAILELDVINHVADIIEKHGSNVWFDWDAKDLLPEGYTHPASPNGEFTKETDIMDVWFDSGTSWAGVVLNKEDYNFPVDMYLEGSDQYRGWFNSSFTTAVATKKHPPYKSVLSHGFVMDGKGQKMSKSLGNVILPSDVMQELGADIIRLWVASVDYEFDVRISDKILKQISESYRKIRNTVRFMLSNVHDFNPETDTVAYSDLRNIDRYMLAKYRILAETVKEEYDHYRFAELYKRVINFITVDLSAFYMDFAKDVLYIESKNSYERRAMQTVIYEILHGLIRLLTPILVHTMEEAWKELPATEGFVQTQEFPSYDHLEVEAKIVEEWQPFFTVRTGVQKALEEAKNWPEDPIKKSFEAAVDLYVSQETADQLNALTDNLAQLLIVSQVRIFTDKEVPESALAFDGYAVEIEPAEGHTCERCRAVRPEVGSIEAAPELCARCFRIIEKDYPEYLEENQVK